MQNANAYKAYKDNNVNYASKERLLLMLLDGAVNFSKLGRQGIVEKDIAKAHENIIKTQNIFYELIYSLDTSIGGEWAKSLMSVYDYIIYRLVQANVKKNLDIMDEVIPLIEELRNTWEEAYRISKIKK
jgi:flagellar protein FliS